MPLQEQRRMQPKNDKIIISRREFEGKSYGKV
jgi:hypothetical protein